MNRGDKEVFESSNKCAPNLLESGTVLSVGVFGASRFQD